MDNLDNQIWGLITRVLAGEASRDEKETLQQWLQEDPGRAAFFKKLKSSWQDEADENVANSAFLYNYESGLKKLRNKISSAEKDFSGAVQMPVQSNKFSAVKIGAFIGLILLSIATAVFIGKTNWVQPTTTYKTSDIEQRIVTLPDGSSVRLNRSSEISFLQDFAGKNREVTLKGEAFFELSGQSDKPFLIHAGDAVIRDIGTSFNVKQEETGGLIVAVKDGIVSLNEDIDDLNSGSLIHAGEIARRSESGDIEVKKSNVGNYLSWMNGRLSFRDAALTQVVAQLEDIYNIRCEFENGSLGTLKLTAITQELNLIEVLDMIALSLDISYRKDDRTVTWLQNKSIPK